MNKCFQVSIRYGERMNAMMEREGFAGDEEEIGFFKSEKPRFTGMIEYYLLRYQAALCSPQTKEDRVQFWRAELRKMDKFRADNSAFWVYYHSGDTAQDRIWFMRISKTMGTPDKSRWYNQDPRTSCPKDWVVAMIVACGLYREYIHEMMVHYL